MTKIGFLGCGSWGFCLASLLASKGYDVVSWSSNSSLVEKLNKTKIHPHFPKHPVKGNIHFTNNIKEAVEHADIIVESVTAAGIRPICERIKKLNLKPKPLIIASKGIEQNTLLTLPEVVIDVFGEDFRPKVGFLSGPGFAQEIISGLPSSVVGTGYNPEMIKLVCDTFTTNTFRVYPNSDIMGVSLGGALKNIIAIACGISDGLKFGLSSRAALMTRGLHEIRKIAVACGCKADTINGLAGMGDLCLTCSSPMSRNFRFGELLAQGHSTKEALEIIGMAVEGAYTCDSAMQLGEKYNIPLPITEMVCMITNGKLKPVEAVTKLMQRTVKEEHL
jgi:glycerol-3-phosphate dehydrogenase (NAD(P)+)